MIDHELTDPAGGALTITHDHQGVWITATEDRDEVTVGPFPVTSLTEAVTVESDAEVSGDLMDGGVTAAAIEAEVDTLEDKMRRVADFVAPDRARSLVQENDELRARIGRVEEARDLYRRDTLTEERLHGEARRFALAWKETARKMFLERRTLISYAEMCKGSVERAAEDRRAADHFQAAYKQAAARGKRYREERREAEDALREAQEVVKSLRAMTPRDHLGAAFAGGYRRKGGMIPQGTEFIAFLGHRPGEGVRVSVAPKDLPEIEDHCERRLLDPEPPSRPEGAEDMESFLVGLDYLHDETGASRADLVTLANDLALLIVEQGAES